MQRQVGIGQASIRPTAMWCLPQTSKPNFQPAEPPLASASLSALSENLTVAAGFGIGGKSGKRKSLF
jgi:hypothetical protein